ncbi:MAG TPA: hypothetical protein VJ729_12830 [Nitrososphaeraceae archaeon]|nr:hypothetical protein [Nitrososphaeraceae archaeon]
MNQVSEQDESYEKIDEIREDNIDAANRQLRFRKKVIVPEDTNSDK